MKKKPSKACYAFVAGMVVFSLLCTVSDAWAEKIRIAYTGNTYAALYPCGTCPASMGGGVSRRAEALRELAAGAQLIIVDSGNFTASGFFDAKSINPTQDEKRSRFYYQAMQAMGYEVAALGENDFAFGLDYIKEQAAKNTPVLVSANIAIEGIQPYYIKEVSGYRIAFIGLSPKSIYKKFGIEVKDYEETLKKVLSQLEGKCDSLVLLSALGDQESKRLAERFPRLAAIIVSGPFFENLPVEKVGQTFLLRSRHEGKRLGVITFDTKDESFAQASFDEEPLSLDRAEDAAITRMIPACFRDEDCLSREGLVSKCQDGGDISAVCAYYAAEKINARIITDQQCLACSIELTERLLKDNFIGIQFRKIDYASQEGKDLIARYKTATLPLFVIDTAIENEKKFQQFSQAFQKHDDAYVLTKDLAGMFMFLDRKEDPRRIDLFIDLYEPRARGIFSKLLDFAEANNINVRTHILAVPAKGRDYAEEERDVALAVKELFARKANEYLLLRMEQITKTSWVNTLDGVGINYKRIQRLLRSKKMDSLRQKNSSLARELGVKEGNVMLIKNNRIFKVFDINAAELKQMFAQDS